MIVSDLRGSLAPKYYATALSPSLHACTAAAIVDWSHIHLRMRASAGLYNLRWSMRDSDRIGVSSSDPAAVSIFQSSPSSPHSLLLPLLFLHLSHEPNFAACDSPPFKIHTSALARVCISEAEVWQGEEEGVWQGQEEGAPQFCTKMSGEAEVALRCSASPTAGQPVLLHSVQFYLLQ